MVRRHAEVVVQDDIVFPVFKKFCKVSDAGFKSQLSSARLGEKLNREDRVEREREFREK